MKTPEYLIVYVRSNDCVSVDVEVKVPRGQVLTLALGKEESDKFKLVLGPGCPRDQKKFIVSNGGLMPAPVDEPW